MAQRALQIAVSDAAMIAAASFDRAGWQWRVRDGESVDPYVPTVADIEKTLWHLVENAMTFEQGGSTRTGRLGVDRDEEGTLNFWLDLGAVYDDSQ